MQKLFTILVVAFLGSGAFAQDTPMKMKDNGMMKMDTMKKDCAMMKDGKMMLVKHGDSIMMDSTVTLNNGAMVMTDGTIKMKDGTTKMLQEGYYIDMDGKMGMLKKKTEKEKR